MYLPCPNCGELYLRGTTHVCQPKEIPDPQPINPPITINYTEPNTSFFRCRYPLQCEMNERGECKLCKP